MHPTPPPHPPILIWPPQRQQEDTEANQPDTQPATRPPPTLRVEPVPCRSARDLSQKRHHHEARIDAIPSLGITAIDGGAVRNLGDLEACVEEEGEEDGARDGEVACEGTYEEAGEGDELAYESGEHGDEFVDEGAGVDGGEEDAGNDDEGEEADDEGGVEVGGAREEEGQGCPEGGEGCGGAEADERGLHKDWVAEEEGDDV